MSDGPVRFRVNRIFASNLLQQRTGPNPPHAPPPQKPTATTTNADSTLKSSQAVVHPSTNGALRHLTSEFRRDLVHWTRYGRQRHLNLEPMNSVWEMTARFPLGGHEIVNPWVIG